MNIIIGTAQLIKNYGIVKSYVGIKEFNKILKYSNSNKNNYIDTAIDYSQVDNILSKLNLKNHKIITKISNINNNNYETKILTHKKKLKVEFFYAILLHNENELLGKNSDNNYNKLVNLKKKKLSKKIGVSCYSYLNAKKIIKKYKIDIIQVPLNLFDKRFISKKFIKLATKKKIKIHYRSIYLQGLLLNDKLYKKHKYLKKRVEFKNFFQWIKNRNVSILALIFSFLKYKNIHNVVIGFKNLNEYKSALILSKKKLNYIDFPKLNIKQNDRNRLIRIDKWQN